MFQVTMRTRNFFLNQVILMLKTNKLELKMKHVATEPIKLDKNITTLFTRH